MASFEKEAERIHASLTNNQWKVKHGHYSCARVYSTAKRPNPIAALAIEPRAMKVFILKGGGAVRIVLCRSMPHNVTWYEDLISWAWLCGDSQHYCKQNCLFRFAVADCYPSSGIETCPFALKPCPIDSHWNSAMLGHFDPFLVSVVVALYKISHFHLKPLYKQDGDSGWANFWTGSSWMYREVLRLVTSARIPIGTSKFIGINIGTYLDLLHEFCPDQIHTILSNIEYV
jgi:hypothetical protein